MKETNLIPKHLKPSYLPKIKVKEHFRSPISRQNKVKALIVIMVFSLFYVNKDIENK